jgi:nitrous oxide reductase accessory protein NosL
MSTALPSRADGLAIMFDRADGRAITEVPAVAVVHPRPIVPPSFTIAVEILETLFLPEEKHAIRVQTIHDLAQRAVCSG